MRHLHLIWPAPADPEALRVAAPKLHQLTRCAAQVSATDQAQAVCQALGIARQHDWPLAPLLAAGAGLDARTGYWLCMDPVAFEVGMNGLTLRRAEGVTEAEMAALLESLAPLPGGELHAARQRRCYWRLPQVPRLLTQPPESVFDQTLPHDWLGGEEAGAFQRVMNGVQISLHQLPLNRLREDQGRLPIGGLWPWGGGAWPVITASPDALWGEGELAQALALAAGLPLRPVPARYADLGDADQGLALLTGQDLEALERDWFVPLVRALRWGRLQRLTLSLTGAAGQCYRLTPRDLWLKAWCRRCR